MTNYRLGSAESLQRITIPLVRLLFYHASSYNYKFTKTITRFAKADARPEAAENYIDAAGNQIPLWYDEGKTTLYYYLEPGKKMTLRTTDGNNSLFKDMSDAVSIETGDFDTSKVTNMDYMFSNCKALTSLDVSSFDTSKVTSMDYMFGYCQSLTSLDVSSFDTSKITSMGYMFGYCQSLTTITASEKFITDNVTDSSRMFANCTSLKGGAGTVYDENHTDKEYARIDGGTEKPGYFTKKQ